MHRDPDQLDLALAPILPTVCGSVAMLEAIWTAVDLITLRGQWLPWLAGACGVAAILVAVLGLLLHRKVVEAAWASPAAAFVVLTVGLNGAAVLAATAQPQYAAWVMLAAVGAGVLVLSRRWYLATILLLWLTWCGASYFAIRGRSSAAHDPSVYTQLAIVTVAATAVSALLHHWRTTAISDLAAARDQAAQAEVRDSLTGVANMSGLTLLGGQVLEAARRHGDAVHCLVLDIDGLGIVNHELGRLIGDDVLVGVADSLIGATRSGDVVARWGGDEFVVIGAGAGPSALEVERRVRAGLVESPPAAPSVWPGRVSAGRAVKEPWDDDDLQSLLDRAHREMMLRRALRREAAGSPYRPSSVDRSELPPTQRPRPGAAPQTW
ncbi:MAG: GGDEF domain-containing protein [Actinomycetota bacterium]|nr:GGDEF domain-containing protein [Actinomycetota bacterium]